ncbi:MAG: hypothetical protein JW709_12930 [Sedimentisphaerales bacterium]|nr:hypothetical protein [Sedimentisphaerales bacterium]
MFNRQQIRQRAYMMGIATGDMPNVDLIWAAQEHEGHQACFGNGRHCAARHCRWRKSCLALDFHADHRLPIARSSQSETTRTSRKQPIRVKPMVVPPPSSLPVIQIPTAQIPINNHSRDEFRQHRRRITRLAPPNALPLPQTAQKTPELITFF